jgi:hypothetical protein
MSPGLATDAGEKPPAPSSGKPNILLIVADDMGFSDTSPHGGEIFTPNIASLAYQGAMFTNFHVAPTCTPTRAMLLTGRDNHVVGVGNMKELLADNQFGKPGTMVFKLGVEAQKRWRRLNGSELIPKVVTGVIFLDGEELTEKLLNCYQPRMRLFFVHHF